jgi:alpha-mannosidase
MMLSLLRSTQIVAYGFGGGYEPGMSSDTGFEVGKKLAFDYALVPHSGDWSEAAIYRHGLEFNQPLLCYTVASHAGELPERWGLLDVSAPNVIVSALKPGRDGSAVLRVYEATGKQTSTTIRLAAHVLGAEEVNLMEDPGTELALTDDTLQLDLRPFEIKTIKLQLP